MKPTFAIQMRGSDKFTLREPTRAKIGRGRNGDMIEIPTEDGSKVMIETRYFDAYSIPAGTDYYTKPAVIELCENRDDGFLWLTLLPGEHTIDSVLRLADSTFSAQDGWFNPPSQQ